jgi:hypothetical protein
MNIGEILIWESFNLLLLIPVVIGLVMLVRWIRGQPVFTERIGFFFSAIHGKSLLTSLVAKIRRAMGRGRGLSRPWDKKTVYSAVHDALSLLVARIQPEAPKYTETRVQDNLIP